MEQQVCLRWNNFHSSLVSTLEYLWDEESLVDVTLFCEGQEIRAHKVVLSACSTAFKTLLKNNTCQHPVIILHNISLSDLEAILQFIYKGEVNIEQDQLSSLLDAATSLQIRGLSGIAEREKISTVSEEPVAKKVRKCAQRNQNIENCDSTLKKKMAKKVTDVNDINLLIPKEEPINFDEEMEMNNSENGKEFESHEFSLTEQSDFLDNPTTPATRNTTLHSEDTTHETTSGTNQAFTCRNSQYPPYPCPFCCRAYTSWGFRRRHIKAMHTLSTHLACKWCSTVLPSRDQWENHVVVEHHLSKSDAEQGLMVLEEAHMVLQTPNPTKLDTLVDMVKQGKEKE